MTVNFQTVQDTLIALSSLVGIVLLFAIAVVAASAYGRRDKARRIRPGTPVPASPIAQHPTQSDDRQLVLR
jgi:hypothetical protein